jgi:hypothetical protein
MGDSLHESRRQELQLADGSTTCSSCQLPSVWLPSALLQCAFPQNTLPHTAETATALYALVRR